MHRIFQNFIDHLSIAPSSVVLRDAMADAATALDLSCFAYLAIPQGLSATPQVISTYPVAWTSRYLQGNYQRFDPVISQALPEPTPSSGALTQDYRRRPDNNEKCLTTPPTMAFVMALRFQYITAAFQLRR